MSTATLQIEKKKTLVPQLRFQEFDGEWDEIKLGKLAEKIGDGLHGTPIYSENSDINFINGNNLTNGKIEITEKTKKVDYSIFKKNDKSLNENTILISLNGTIGNIAKYNDEKVMLGKSVGYFNFKENRDFYFHVFHTDKIQNFFISELTGSTIKNLSLKTLRETIFPFPTLPEQQKIANFLNTVDKKIQQLTRKTALLEQYKKGVMQQLFSYEIRIVKDGKLRRGCLGDFGFFYYGKGAPKTSIFKDAQTPCVRYGELYSTYKEEIKKIKSYTNINPKDLKLSKGGEVLVPRVGEDPRDFANCSYLPFPNVAIGEMISVYNTDEDGLFMTYYINAMLKKQLAKLVEGGNVSNLYFRYVETIEIEIPSKEEQQKIANFLSGIDSKIEKVKQQLAQTQKFKKGLLQQMFV
ncbi:MAG: restriction endonuclease subunit S [Bacteroidota bacterium]